MAHVHPGAYPFGATAGSGGGGGGSVTSVFGRDGVVEASVADYAGLYLRLGTADTIVARHTFNPGSALSPFILHANAQGQLVTGLNADQLDGLDSTAFATAAHVHSAADVTSGLLALARGGTHTDLSATGGAKRVLFQESAGADITVRIIAASDLPDLSATYQPFDADLTAIAALTSAADKLPYATGSGTWALADFSAAGRELVNDADAAAQRTTLGLGTIATFNDAPSDGSTYGRKNGAWEAVSGSGATTFLALTDTPSAFTSQALKLVRVNAAETALEFVDGATVYQPLDADLTSWASVARASGFDTFVATPSSANLRSLLTDETGTGAAVFATSPSLVTPLLGTPTSGTLTNCTGLPQAGTVGLTTADSPQFAGVNLGHASDTTIARSAAGKIAVEAKAVPLMSGAFDLVLAGPSAARTWTGPDADATLVSQGGALGTPSSGTLTNCTGLPGSGLASGVRPVSTYLGYKTGLSDAEYCGDTLEGTAGAALAFGQLCYLAAADSRWELADADAASTAGDVLLGICVLAAASDGSATRMLLKGTIRANSQFPTLTIGGPVHVGTTAGEVQTAPPSETDDVIRRVGWGLTGDEMLFNPSNDYETHT